MSDGHTTHGLTGGGGNPTGGEQSVFSAASEHNSAQSAPSKTSDTSSSSSSAGGKSFGEQVSDAISAVTTAITGGETDDRKKVAE
ncbi:hypothetical protein JCM6882_002006 [Rhodosporidiobolus microsporus]